MKKLTEYLNENQCRNFISEVLGRETNNRGGLVSINETNARTMIQKHSEDGYIVISPCRGEDDFIRSGELLPEDAGTQRFRDELNKLNQKRIRQMVSQIKTSGYSYTPVYGGFIENIGTKEEVHVYERSFVIYNQDKYGNTLDFNKLYNLGLDWCNQYNQDSFLVQFPVDSREGGLLAYVDKNGQIDMEFKKGATFNDISKQYFTDLHKYHTIRQDSKLTRITFESLLEDIYVNPGPQCYSEGHTRHLSGEKFVTTRGFV